MHAHILASRSRLDHMHICDRRRTQNPKPQIPNPKPYTPLPQPQTLTCQGQAPDGVWEGTRRPKLLDYTTDRKEMLYRSGDIFKWLGEGNLKVPPVTLNPKP